MKTKIVLGLFFFNLTLFLAACTPAIPQGSNPYTQGNVTMTLKKGVTTQAQVSNVFGAPNIVTQESGGNTVWIYQKVATFSRSSRAGLAGLLVGPSGAGLGTASMAGTQTGESTMTLQITFNQKGIVKDYKSMSTTF